MITLDDIASEPAQAETLTPDTARELWKRLLVASLAILPHLYNSSVEPSIPDRLLDVKETAKRLDISVLTLYRTADDFPFTRRYGRALKFSERGIDRWLEHKK